MLTASLLVATTLAQASAFPTAAAALQEILKSEPRVLAVGELHQTKATARIPSALKRFTTEFLAPLRKAGATDLVVETWIATGACGEVEQKAVGQVAKTTKRPKHTENELVTLLKAAKSLGYQSRILEVGCKDYQALLGGAEVDFEKLLRLTKEQLEKQIEAALARSGSALVVSYGGALHNDVSPAPEVAAYAFGPAIAKATDGRYVELDVYVPEYVDKNKTVRAEPWFQDYARAVRPGQFMLVRRSEASFALVFPRTARGRATRGSPAPTTAAAP